MATDASLNSLVERRRKAAEARKAASKAAPPTRDTIDLTPNADEALINERRAAQAATGASMTLPVEPKATTMAVPTPLRDRSRDLGTGDVIIPKLKLSQAMSKVNTDNKVRQGNYYLSTTGQDFGPEVYIVPVDMQMSLSKFEQGIGVVCRSYDLVHGEGDPGILCEGTQEEIDSGIPASDRGCPFRLWTKNEATGKSVPPPCGKNYNYPVLILDPNDLENGKPTMALFSLRSTGVQAAKLINSIVTEGVLTNPVWHESIIRLGVETKTNPRGSFYVTTVEYVQETAGTVEKRAEKFAQNFQASTAVYRRSMENDDTE